MTGNVRTTCRHCGASFGGRAAHCPTCHETFSSDSGFDRHLVSRVTAGCLDPATQLDKHERPVFTRDAHRNLWKLANHSGTVTGWWRS
jgi:hypothetical protein